MSKTFTIILRQVVVPHGESEGKLPARAAARIGCKPEDILACQPVRRSIDARKRRGKAVDVYHLRLELPNSLRRQIRKATHLDVIMESGGPNLQLRLTDPAPKAGPRPVVVGAGPAGLFAALRLAQAGWKPLLIERGVAIDDRRSVAAAFWRDGILDPESNVLFGEGGAGLFSDGKLNTRHKDRDGMAAILAAMVEAGAPEDIRLHAAPHVGSDLLGMVVNNISQSIRDWGGEVCYRTAVTDIHRDDGQLRGITVRSEGKESYIECDTCILATGHSARDIYEMLNRRGIGLEPKPFAAGVRVEMPQDQIDKSQRNGPFKPGPGEAASFRLSRAPVGNAEACYTFCMCPGGLVIACASEPGRLAVNGMSYHARAGEFGNAAFLSPVTPEDFPQDESLPPALAGVAWQRAWEEKAYAAGSGDYSVPASTLADFIAGRTGSLPERMGVSRARAADLRPLLPERIAATLADAVPAMLRRLRAVREEDVVLYAIETRTSSPVRVSRGADGATPICSGLFPAGEGSGYAGGIMTSALDGWNAAGKAMNKR